MSLPCAAQYPGGGSGGGYPGGGGGYPGGSAGGWVPCDANGNPLSSGAPGLNSDGSAALMHTGSQPTADNTYPIPKTGAPSWWYGCYSPQAPGGGSYSSPGAGLGTSSRAGNWVTGQTGGISTIGYYDPVYCAGDRPGSAPQPPNLNGTVTTNGSDTLKARFVWTGTGTAPTQATFIVHTSVSAAASVSGGGVSATATATLGNDTVTATDGGSSGSKSGGSYQAQQVSPSGGIATVSLSASVSTTTKNTLAYGTWTGSSSSTYYYNGPGAGQTVANASAGATGSVYPATITLSGTAPDSSGALNILVGQGCTASLNTPPFGVSQQSGWSWNISGTKFKNWIVSSDQQTATLIPVPSPLTDPTPKWFWNDPGPNPTPETVSCTATVTPPTGQGSPFTVTATQKVAVQVPGWTASGAGGYMQVNTRAPSQGGVPALWAGPSPGQTGGMNWTATCTTPQTPVAFGTGTLQLVQIVTPNQSYISDPIPGVVHNDPENGMNGLDTGYPYPAPAYTEGTVLAPFKTNDNPSIALPNSTRSVSMTHQFTDYLMYLPPSGGNDIQWVPRGTFTWSTNGNATIPSTGDWTNYATQHGSDSAGTVNPSATTPFTPGNTFPSWTRINVFPPF